jgi:hypothetical protein
MTEQDARALNDLIIQVDRSLLILNRMPLGQKNRPEVIAAVNLYSRMKEYQKNRRLDPLDAATLQWIIARLRGKLRVLGENV